MKYFILPTILLITTLNYNLTAQQISSEDYNKDYIHEDFNHSVKNFKIVTTSDNYFILDKGDYLLSRNNKESEYAIIANNSIVSDFVLKTFIRIGPSDNKKASIGIILKAQQDGKGAVIFEINKQREYRIKQLVGSVYQILSRNTKQEGWVKSGLISGVDEHNFIEIRSEKNIYDVYVNNEYLTTFFVPDFTSGSCGIIISPETKARVSYYYINIKGENTLVANYTNENTTSLNTSIEELNKKIKLLEENNAKLNALNNKTKKDQKETISKLKNENANLAKINIEQEKKISSLSRSISSLKKNNTRIKELEAINQSNTTSISNLENKNNTLTQKITRRDKEIESLNQTIIDSGNKAAKIEELKTTTNNIETKNTHLTSITKEQERKINSLTATNENLRNSSNKVTTSNKQLNKKVKTLKEEVSLKQSINTELINDLDKVKTSSNSKINKLNSEVKTLKSKVTKLETSNSTLSANLSKEKSAHKQTKSGLATAIKNKTKKEKELSSELNNTTNELSMLKATQATHNDITTDLNNQVTDLNNKLEVLNNQLNTSNNNINTLKAKNSELKELFIQKDFELNGVKPSEMVKQTSNKPAPKILENKKLFYTVQFGVFMQEQVNSSIKSTDDVWYNITENGTYIYYSGEFNSPKEATAHKNKVTELYPNAFVITLTK